MLNENNFTNLCLFKFFYVFFILKKTQKKKMKHIDNFDYVYPYVLAIPNDVYPHNLPLTPKV